MEKGFDTLKDSGSTRKGKRLLNGFAEGIWMRISQRAQSFGFIERG